MQPAQVSPAFRRVLPLLWFVALAAAASPALADAPAASPETLAEPIYDGSLRGKWEDWGWAERDLVAGKAARLKFSSYHGWRLANRHLTANYSSLRFHLRAPANFGDFLEVRLTSEGDDSLPRIPIGAAHRKPLADGWQEVRVSMAELNPQGAPFTQVVLRALSKVEDTWLEIDHIGLFSDGRGPPPPPAVAYHPTRLVVDCAAPSHRISPYIYGIAYNPRKNARDAHLWSLGATARRWGGNPASRYNWQLGNAWNSALDWYFLNLDYTNQPGRAWESFLRENRSHQVASVVTVPLLGWVAKDTCSYSYPKSVDPDQSSFTGRGADIGSGKRPGKGGYLPGVDPTRTSVPASPEFVGDWVRAIRQADSVRGGRLLNHYILDNEPALWNSTHHDVHPEPLTYDELLERTIAYASAVKKADPGALVAGPAEWGWPAYFFSAKDAADGFGIAPDRRAHGNTPLLAYYLKTLQAHEAQTGVRLLDILDVHFYPQVNNTYGRSERTDARTNDARLRATRSLWDPGHRDESWIADTIRLIPRLRELIAENYPGTRLSIGEWNFGAEQHINGGLALAETLGRFGQEDVYSAFYWTYPPANSPAFHAFRAYRNYDGQGAHFLERSVATTGDATTSVFASRSEDGKKLVAVVLNLDPRGGAEAQVELRGCGNLSTRRTFQYSGGPEGLRPLGGPGEAAAASTKLPPYSMTVLELRGGAG